MRLSRAEAPERLTKFYVRKFSGHYWRLLGTGVPEQLSLLLGFCLPRYPRLPSLGLLCPIRDYLFWVTFSLTVIHLHVASWWNVPPSSFSFCALELTWQNGLVQATSSASHLTAIIEHAHTHTHCCCCSYNRPVQALLYHNLPPPPHPWWDRRRVNLLVSCLPRLTQLD